MSKYDKASLVMIPSGYKADKLYSVLPVNGNGDFDHDRNSVATRVNKDGLIETVAADIPRLDYALIDGVVQDCPSLLLEPARTNLITYSEDSSNASWAKSNNPTITTNIAIAPDGTLTADGIQDENGADLKAIYQSASVSSNSTVTISVFVKKESTKTNSGGLMLYFSGGTTKYVYGIIDEVNGTIAIAPSSIISSSSAKVEDYGAYWRFTLTGTDNGNNTTARFQYYASFSTNGTTITGNSIGSVRTIWGAQLEVGSYATSYIPTTTATVTRSADVCDKAGTAAEFNDSEGVLFADIAALADDSSLREIALSDGSLNNRLELRYGAASNRIQFVARSGGVVQASISNEGNNIILNNKIAVKYKLNDWALWVNGFELGIDNSGSIPIGLSELAFDSGAGAHEFYGKTKELAVFKEALTDSELEALTSWDSFNDMAKGQLYTIE